MPVSCVCRVRRPALCAACASRSARVKPAGSRPAVSAPCLPPRRASCRRFRVFYSLRARPFFSSRLPACSSRARGFPFTLGWGFGGEGFAGGERLCCRRVGGWPSVSCVYFLSVFAFGFDSLEPHEVSLYFCGFFCAVARPACRTSFSRMLNP